MLSYEFFQIFKIHFITAVVLCLGGGIGEISSLVSLFYVNACIFAVFERQWNKCSPVATTSSPSHYALLRDPLEAVTGTNGNFNGSIRFQNQKET